MTKAFRFPLRARLLKHYLLCTTALVAVGDIARFARRF